MAFSDSHSPWSKAAFRATPQHCGGADWSTGRRLLLACAGLVSAQASGTGTNAFCYTMDGSLLTFSLWHFSSSPAHAIFHSP